MEKGDKVKFKNNQNEVDDLVCELVEIKDAFCRIKKPSGEVLRIFSDRVFLADSNEKNVGISDECLIESSEFDPWLNLPEGGQVWIKENNGFNSMNCKTFAIVVPSEGFYKSINTYDGTAKKAMEYPMKSIDSLVMKLVRKGYIKSERQK